MAHRRWPWAWNALRSPQLFFLFALFFVTALVDGHRETSKSSNGARSLGAVAFFFAEWTHVFVMCGLGTIAFLGSVAGFDWAGLRFEVVEMNGKQYITTEMGVLELGPVRMLTVPGELLPELAVGGYDGSQMFTEMADFIDPNNPNPPDVTMAPQGPYLKQRLGSPYTWLLGLGNDELGYIIPNYDFVLSDSLPYLSEAEGDHYEETNSLGPHMAELVDQNTDFLVEFIDWL